MSGFIFKAKISELSVKVPEPIVVVNAKVFLLGRHDVTHSDAISEQGYNV